MYIARNNVYLSRLPHHVAFESTRGRYHATDTIINGRVNGALKFRVIWHAGNRKAFECPRR